MLFLHAEPIELLLDHLPDAFWHRRHEVADRAPQLPLLPRLPQHTGRNPVIHEGHQEKWVALRALMQPPDQEGGECARGKPRGEILCCCALGESREREFLAAPVLAQFLLDPFQGVPRTITSTGRYV